MVNFFRRIEKEVDQEYLKAVTDISKTNLAEDRTKVVANCAPLQRCSRRGWLCPSNEGSLVASWSVRTVGVVGSTHHSCRRSKSPSTTVTTHLLSVMVKKGSLLGTVERHIDPKNMMPALKWLVPGLGRYDRSPMALW